MKKTIILLAMVCALVSCKSLVQTQYTNPVIRHNCADPTMLDDRARTGYLYAYSTNATIDGKMAYLPVYKSKDMVNWEYCGDGFSAGAPQWAPGGGNWAPDINYFDGHYVVYYAMGFWTDNLLECRRMSASGVAVSDSPTGPFIDKGMIVDWPTTGVSNGIDPNFFEDEDGKRYLFWGSFGIESGNWVIELAQDGLSVKEGAKPVQIGNKIMEGSYVMKKDGYYYYFGSKGTCCMGGKSTYHIVVARAENPMGPYLGPDGKNLLDNDYDYTILQSPADGVYAGPGHNAQLIMDDAGQYWMPYHVYWSGNNFDGRCLAIDQVLWDENGWPYFKNGIEPTRELTEGPKWFKE